MSGIVSLVIPIVALLILIFVVVSLHMIDRNTSEMKTTLANIQKIILEYIRIKEEEGG